MMDRNYGVSTSELRGEDRNYELEQQKRELSKAYKSTKNLIELNKLVFEVVLHCLELKNNPIAGKQDLKPIIARSLVLYNELDKKKKVMLMFNLELDIASKNVKDLVEIKPGEKNVYKIYLAAKEFCAAVETELNYMSQIKEIKKIIDIELKQSLENAFADKNLDTKTLVYLAKEGLLK